jgi:hypothetical protein
MNEELSTVGLGSAPMWQERLIEERRELLEKTLKLKKSIDNKDFKVNFQEWEFLRNQYGIMREYLRVLTDRCKYYGLVEAENLDIY